MVRRSVSPGTNIESPGGAAAGGASWLLTCGGCASTPVIANQEPVSVILVPKEPTVQLLVPAALSRGMFDKSPGYMQSANSSRTVAAPTFPVMGALPELSAYAPLMMQVPV